MRLTIDDDLTTDAGLNKAVNAVSNPRIPTLLFGALPCTGGSPYQFLNWQLGPKTRAKIRHHRSIFNCLWKAFVTTAEACIAAGGKIAFEWPRNCMYWRLRKVKAFLKKHGMKCYKFDGCMYNLRSEASKTHGKFLQKPWIIASNCPEFAYMERRCNHTREQHAKTAGSDTRRTEGYTDEMADEIHGCWRHHLV